MSNNRGGEDMMGSLRLWVWLLTASVGIGTAFGGALYDNLQKQNQVLSGEVKELYSTMNNSRIAIAENQKDVEEITEGIARLEKALTGNFDALNSRLDTLALELARRDYERKEATKNSGYVKPMR